MNNHTLSDEQKQVIEKFEKGKNLFITGPGGVGKSFLIKKLVEVGNNMFKLNGKRKKYRFVLQLVPRQHYYNVMLLLLILGVGSSWLMEILTYYQKKYLKIIKENGHG